MQGLLLCHVDTLHKALIVNVIRVYSYEIGRRPLSVQNLEQRRVAFLGEATMDIPTTKKHDRYHTDCIASSNESPKPDVIRARVPGPTKDASFKGSFGKWLSRFSTEKPLLERRSKQVVPQDDPKTRCHTLSDDEWKYLLEVVKEWNFAVEDLVLDELLGVGTFGTTYKGICKGRVCAVKKIRVTSDSMRQFVREVQALSAVQDPNVVGFKGVVVNQGLQACWIIQEYMAGGTLNDVIRKNKCAALAKKSVSKKLQILRDVAKGMAALQATTLHRDLKPSNIFLDEMMTAKIGDLGLAKKLLSGDMTGETGTYLYMAPEVIMHSSYGNSADVWSWGATVVEVMTCKFPYQDRLLTPIQIATEVMQHKMRPELPQQVTIPKLRDLLDRCCAFDPSKRPKFTEIVLDMDEIIEQQIEEETSKSLDRSWSISNLFEI